MYSVEKVEIILTVPSIEGTAAWYERVLGWKGHFDTFDSEGNCRFGSVMRGDMEAVMRGEEPSTAINLSRLDEDPATYNTEQTHLTVFIAVDDVDAVYDRAVQGGVTPGCPPENQPWGGRVFWLRDLNGFVLSFYQLVEKVTLEEIRRRYEEEGEEEQGEE